MEIDPNNATVYNNRGNAKFDLKDYYGAIPDYSKAIEINPKYATAYSNRGNAKELFGDLVGACSDWRQTVYLSPNAPAANWIRDQC